MSKILLSQNCSSLLGCAPIKEGEISMLIHRVRELMVIMALIAAGTSFAGSQAWAARDCSGGFSESIRLTGSVANPRLLTLDDLAAYNVTTLPVSFFSGPDGLVTRTFVGVSLEELLADAMVITDPGRPNDILRKIIRVVATDCYEVVVSVSEVLSKFGAHPVIVAYGTINDFGEFEPLDETRGMARLVFPNDKAGGRSVFNIRWMRVLP